MQRSKTEKVVQTNPNRIRHIIQKPKVRQGPETQKENKTLGTDETLKHGAKMN